MKKIISVLLFLLPFNLFAQKQIIKIWYTSVEIPTVIFNAYYHNFAPKILAEDLALLLEKNSNLIFEPTVYDGKSKTGIFLLLDSSSKTLSNEDAVINSDGNSFIKITGKYGTGLSYGMYTYLNKLGYKFYLPGENWNTFPVVKNIFYSKINNEIWKPYFKVRTFTLSGAMYPVKTIDPTGENYKSLCKWNQRNRMGSEYLSLGGHIGEQFNIENKIEIDKDSTLLAPVDGKRQYNVMGKLDPTNEKGIKLFSDWIIKQYKINNALLPKYLPSYAYQTVDPGDGLNYCKTELCKSKFKSISDQVFYIANKAALKIKLKFPNAGVNTFAYTERADTPTIKIEDNVHVSIVSTAFQDVTTPTALIKRWAIKTKRISVSDYLNIPVWSFDQPNYNLKNYFNFLEFGKKNKVEGFEYESGGSSMASGLLQYFILNYLSNPYTDIDLQFDKFCKDVFGNAFIPMNKLLREWYFSDKRVATGYDYISYNEADISRYVNYINEALLCKNLTAIELKRIFEIKTYFIYLVKYHEAFNDIEGAVLNKKKPDFYQEKLEDLLDYIWSNYSTFIFHNTALNDALIYRNGKSDLIARWNYGSSNKFNVIKKISPQKIDDLYREISKKYTSNDCEIIDEQTLVEKAFPYRADTVKIKMIDAVAFGNYRYTLKLYCNKPEKIEIYYKTKIEKKATTKLNDIGYVNLSKDDYELSQEKIISPNVPNGKFTLIIAKKGFYNITFAQHNATSIDYTVVSKQSILYINKSIIPYNGISFMTDFNGTDAGNKYLAFYAGNIKTIDFNMIYTESQNFVSIYNAKGKEKVLDISKAPYKIIANLDSEDKNTFMFFSNKVFRWPPEFKNIPTCFFFLKFPLKKNSN